MDMSSEVELGRVVFSVAGHDKDRYYIVMKAEQNGYIYIADGDVRKVSSPKKKRIKHVQIKGDIIEELRERMEQNKPILDHEIRKYLDEYNQNTHKEG